MERDSMEALKILEKKENISWDYDADADVLYISAGEPDIAEGLDLGEGIIARIHPHTSEIIGLTIYGLRRRIMGSAK